MIIYKEKASRYNSINTESIVRYITEYNLKNMDIINNATNGNGKQMVECDRKQLKAIAAELETVNKRLEYILNEKKKKSI